MRPSTITTSLCLADTPDHRNAKALIALYNSKNTAHTRATLEGFLHEQRHAGALHDEVLAASLMRRNEQMIALYAPLLSIDDHTIALPDQEGLLLSGVFRLAFASRAPGSTDATTVAKEDISIINAFAVPDEKERGHVVEYLEDITRQVMSLQPGFRSAHVHIGSGHFLGQHSLIVANYARWQSAAHFFRVLGNPEATQHMHQLEGAYNRVGGLFAVHTILQQQEITKHE